ncbi:hypothetical protein GGX14DRAFT_623288 [Mycena pura]|uniref:Uncharacterized protein n=1 Tax=Mycena pura TaxID=153505 RepID=A0AAD6VFV7_9AGAR|nr:hypothetical protein GGX14DRAFT_623288 [Mycena pura]
MVWQALIIDIDPFDVLISDFWCLVLPHAAARSPPFTAESCLLRALIAQFPTRQERSRVTGGQLVHARAQQAVQCQAGVRELLKAKGRRMSDGRMRGCVLSSERLAYYARENASEHRAGYDHTRRGRAAVGVRRPVQPVMVGGWPLTGGRRESGGECWRPDAAVGAERQVLGDARAQCAPGSRRRTTGGQRASCCMTWAEVQRACDGPRSLGNMHVGSLRWLTLTECQMPDTMRHNRAAINERERQQGAAACTTPASSGLDRAIRDAQERRGAGLVRRGRMRRERAAGGGSYVAASCYEPGPGAGLRAEIVRAGMREQACSNKKALVTCTTYLNLLADSDPPRWHIASQLAATERRRSLPDELSCSGRGSQKAAQTMEDCWKAALGVGGRWKAESRSHVVCREAVRLAAPGEMSGMRAAYVDAAWMVAGRLRREWVVAGRQTADRTWQARHVAGSSALLRPGRPGKPGAFLVMLGPLTRHLRLTALTGLPGPDARQVRHLTTGTV